MSLLNKYKPQDIEEKRYVIAYQSSIDETKFNQHSAPVAKVEHILKMRPICNTSGKKLNNLPVILKIYLSKKGKYKQKVLYVWNNKKQYWRLNEGVI